MSKPLKIFITYAHKNTDAKDELITHLAVLKREDLIDIWHDNEILPGDKWHDAIFSNLADSDILLYLTSAYSLDSENCNKELAAALSSDTNIRVIPIILDHCDWQNHQLSDFQALPDKGKPITDSSVWKRESEGWQSVANGLRAVINKMQVQAPPPSITPEEVETLSDVKLQQGNFLMMVKQMDAAIAAYSRAIELNPNNAGAYNNRGIAYAEKGELDSAIADFNKAIELDPKLADAYSGRGAVHGAKGELHRALADYNEAIELDPKLANAYNNRANAYGAKGELDRAIENYTKAIELKPELAEVYVNRGNAYRAKGELDRAIVDYTKAIELNPKLAEVYNSRGAIYTNKGELNSAIVNFTKAIELDPDHAEAYHNRGITWLHLQEWENFRSNFSAARDVGIDIAIGFRNVCGSVANFEQRTGIQLPADIASMLTPPQK